MTTARPLIIGEVLFDHFSNGERVLGGAPFNVAWNLRGLGLDPLIVTAVGDDPPGREARRRMEAWGMDLSGLQTRAGWPTGRVNVALKDGQPTFTILDQQAYDHIEYPEFPLSAAGFALLYHGSLAFRGETSRATIRRLIAESGLPRFVDVNIRQPWFDRAWLDELLGGARWVKLNDEELATISGQECREPSEIPRAVEQVRERFGGETYLVTRGSAGAYWMAPDRDVIFVEAPAPERLVDTVGAGDAFAAAAIAGLIQRRPLDEIPRAAAHFASKTCTIQGATTTNGEHYRF